MKLFAILGLVSFVAAIPNEECPHEVEVNCIDDIDKAYPVCQKAAQEKGKDLPADLECMKYFTSIEKDCWPCICLIAHTNHWHIKGCN